MKFLWILILVIAGCGKPEIDDSKPIPLTWKMGSAHLYVNADFSIEFEVTNNSTPLRFMDCSDGELPETVQFSFDKDGQKGVLSGYINKPGEYKFKVSGGCYGTQVSGQSGSEEFTIKILPIDSVQELIKQKKYELVIALADSALKREPENGEWKKVKAAVEALNSK